MTKQLSQICPICGSNLIFIDNDNDIITCKYCGAKWESIDSFYNEQEYEPT